MGPVRELALKRLVMDSAEIEAQFQIIQGCRPLVGLLQRAREEAAAALAVMVDLDLNIETDLARAKALQTEVLRFRDLVRWLRAIVEEGIEADVRISAADHDELETMIAGSPEDDHEAHEAGLPAQEDER